jgi:GT2 family glycosyltransferase
MIENSPSLSMLKDYHLMTLIYSWIAPDNAPVPCQPDQDLSEERPLISVIILNYNGAAWLERCLSSLRLQTLFEQLEVIVADNNSPDGSAKLATELTRSWTNAKVIQHGENLGFCEGNNRAAKSAVGDYLFFLNNDTWLAPDCLERLIHEITRCRAQAGTPVMLNYQDDSIQSSGGEGFDVFGLMSLARPHTSTREIFVVGGCSYLIERQLFEQLGGFDPAFYMYADEYDLSWRVWIAGATAISVPAARLHHRGAASVNPAGGGRAIELRTSDTKRFYTNRNCLLVLLKNCQHVLLLMVPLQIGLLLFEAVVGLLLVRRWSFIKRAYLEAFAGCFKLRAHIAAERNRLTTLRRRSDWQMLRFLRLRPNRWDEIANLRKHGLPKVSAR